MKQKHTKYTHINTNESMHSEMAQCDNSLYQLATNRDDTAILLLQHCGSCTDA